MPAVELVERQALEAIQPLSDFWLAVGMILAAIQNSVRTKGKPVRPIDVLPFLKGPQRPQTQEEIEEIVRQWR